MATMAGWALAVSPQAHTKHSIDVRVPAEASSSGRRNLRFASAAVSAAHEEGAPVLIGEHSLTRKHAVAMAHQTACSWLLSKYSTIVRRFVNDAYLFAKKVLTIAWRVIKLAIRGLARLARVLGPKFNPIFHAMAQRHGLTNSDIGTLLSGHSSSHNEKSFTDLLDMPGSTAETSHLYKLQEAKAKKFKSRYTFAAILDKLYGVAMSFVSGFGAVKWSIKGVTYLVQAVAEMRSGVHDKHTKRCLACMVTSPRITSLLEIADKHNKKRICGISVENAIAKAKDPDTDAGADALAESVLDGIPIDQVSSAMDTIRESLDAPVTTLTNLVTGQGDLLAFRHAGSIGIDRVRNAIFANSMSLNKKIEALEDWSKEIRPRAWFQRSRTPWKAVSYWKTGHCALSYANFAGAVKANAQHSLFPGCATSEVRDFHRDVVATLADTLKRERDGTSADDAEEDSDPDITDDVVDSMSAGDIEEEVPENEVQDMGDGENGDIEAGAEDDLEAEDGSDIHL